MEKPRKSLQGAEDSLLSRFPGSIPPIRRFQWFLTAVLCLGLCVSTEGEIRGTSNMSHKLMTAVEMKGYNILSEWVRAASENNVCSAQPYVIKQHTEIEAIKIYEKLDFSQKILQSRIPNLSNEQRNYDNKLNWAKENKLKIFLVPHSHNDAGWGMTFEEYYNARTEKILNNMLHHLMADGNMTMIWAETSFLNLWWQSLPYSSKLQVRKLLENQQLEIVNGGWVMPDEANVHYFSYLTQLIEGHQWLHQHLNYVPTNSWTIDPFGLTSSFEYLLRKSGMKRNVLARTHYIVKNWFREEKNLEFFWRQEWGKDSSTDVFCYMMPYGSYDTRDTCGPSSPQVCTSFDEPHELWTNGSVIESRSLALLEQYRLKSMEFQTNNVLIPIGGDFRWQTSWEWEGAVSNLKAVMEYFQSRPELNAEMKFATLEDYFKAVVDDLEKQNIAPKVFSGDFFTYSDKKMDYWSGYFSSRMFYKVLERRLMSLVRSSQLIYMLTTGELVKKFGAVSLPFTEQLLERVVSSRRKLSIFQHHDAIAGTSADYVVVDYADKLKAAIHDAQFVLQKCMYLLSLAGSGALQPDDMRTPSNEYFFIPLWDKSMTDSFWHDIIINFTASNPEVTVGIFNSLQTRTSELIQLHVATPRVRVYTFDGEEIDSEVSPNIQRSQSSYGTTRNYDGVNKGAFTSRPDVYINEDYFILSFVANFDPLQIRNFRIVYNYNDPTINTVDVKVYSQDKNLAPVSSVFNVEVVNTSGENSTEDETSIEISNSHVTVQFSRKGIVQSALIDGVLYPLKVTFHHYETDESGLYSFFPLGEALPLSAENLTIILVKGRFLSYVEVWYPHLKHRVTLFGQEGLPAYAIEVRNDVDVSMEQNFELIMRLNTAINSKDTFYTDSNGFQMMKRKRFDKLPLQGNFYPVATSAFIEDSQNRLTILTGQPCGGASLRSGEFEVMIDRIVNQDDNHGIGQGGTDNVPTVTTFRILLEKIQTEEKGPSAELIPMLSLKSHHHLLRILHPVQSFLKAKAVSRGGDYRVPGIIPLPCDVQLVGAFALPKYIDAAEHANDSGIILENIGKFGLVVHRIGFDKRFDCGGLSTKCRSSFESFSVTDVIGMLGGKSRVSDVVTFTDKISDQSNPNNTIALEVMQVYAFELSFI